MGKTQNLYRLNGNIQHYTWGGQEFLPTLLGVSNPAQKPFAEYWMGTHHLSPSYIRNGEKEIPVSEVTQLSFLLKLLDVKDMLSIQVHPSKKAAEIEFARENNERIPLDAPNRNYRDDNHKPELLVAIGEFWLLHGFKKPAELGRILDAVPEFSSLKPIFEKGGYEDLYKTVMGMPQEKVNEILSPLIDRIVPLYTAGVLHKNEEDHWAAKAALTFNKNGIDRGIFSVYFFNLVKLERGEGLFQAAGLPHAYLQGQCVEIMANSDNVLRGGLTTKHIDVKELMKHVTCEPITPDILKGTAKGKENIYETPVRDFTLSAFHLKQNEEVTIQQSSPEIYILLSGEAEFHSGEVSIILKPGQSILLLPGDDLKVNAIEDSELYRAR